MKVTKIVLKDYLHFKKDLVIDLTYPHGHKKAGEPLDRICMLGQSGTGKTTLLNLIKYFNCGSGEYDKSTLALNKIQKGSVEIHFKVGKSSFAKIAGSKPYKFEIIDYSTIQKRKIKEEDQDKFLNKDIVSQKSFKKPTHQLLSFPFCVVGPSDIPESENDLIKKNASLNFDSTTGNINQQSDRLIWDFNSENLKLIWDLVFADVNRYVQEQQKLRIDFAENVLDDVKNAESMVEKFKDKEKKTLNPLQVVAKSFLNPILTHFGMEVETDIKMYFEKSQDKKIIVKSKRNGEKVDYPFLSTGTKQILLTGVPLHFLKPKNSIILFDQPETSLYPNVQLSIPNIYFEIASDTNQFFFATHSPIIASNFDPWEIVELRFDKHEGVVYQQQYYPGDIKNRKKSSYTINPKLLRWDSSYRILFDTNVEGNPEREEELMNLTILEQKIKKIPNMTAHKKQLVKKYMLLAEKLDWKLESSNAKN